MGTLGIRQWLVPHRGDGALDLVVMALDGMGFGQHLGPIARGHRAVVRRGVDQADREGGVAADEGEAGGTQQLVTGHLPSGRDPPEGDLHDVLAPSGAVALDDVGQLLMDAAKAEGRQPLPAAPPRTAGGPAAPRYAGPTSRR